MKLRLRRIAATAVSLFITFILLTSLLPPPAASIMAMAQNAAITAEIFPISFSRARAKLNVEPGDFPLTGKDWAEWKREERESRRIDWTEVLAIITITSICVTWLNRYLLSTFKNTLSREFDERYQARSEAKFLERDLLRLEEDIARLEGKSEP